MHCTFAFKMSLPIVVLCIGTKPRNSSKMSKFLVINNKTPVIKVLKWTISAESVLTS